MADSGFSLRQQDNKLQTCLKSSIIRPFAI